MPIPKVCGKRNEMARSWANISMNNRICRERQKPPHDKERHIAELAAWAFMTTNMVITFRHLRGYDVVIFQYLRSPPHLAPCTVIDATMYYRYSCFTIKR